MTVKGQILKSASLIALVTVISRIFGYLRDQRVALLLGTSPAADAFILAFRIPNMIRRMTGEGALGASFIPVFTGYLRGKPRAEAWEFAQRIFWDMAVILAVIAVLGCVFSKQVIGIFTLLGAGSLHWDLAIFLNRIIFPSVFFMGLAALAAAILNSFHVFGLPASTSVLFNLVFIVFSLGIVYKPILRASSGSLSHAGTGVSHRNIIGIGAATCDANPGAAETGHALSPECFVSGPRACARSES